MIFGPQVGTLVDRIDRLLAARICIVVENASILVAIAACCCLLTRAQKRNEGKNVNSSSDKNKDSSSSTDFDNIFIFFLTIVHVFGSLSLLFYQIFGMAIERDWVVVLSQQTDQPGQWLGRTNVVLRQIYLLCKVLAPIAAGWIVELGQQKHTFDSSNFDQYAVTIFMVVLCTSSFVVESVCTTKVYNLIPTLRLRQRDKSSVLEKSEEVRLDGDDNQSVEDWRDEGALKNHHEEMTTHEHEQEERTGFWPSFLVYWKQPIVWAGLSLALIYDNALCFGGAMTTFLIWKGMSVEEVALWTGVNNSVGLVGTFAFHFSIRQTNIINTGVWSVVYLFVCLTLAVLSFWVPGSHNSMYLLVVGTSVSRVGLWVFDISVTMLYQNMVPDGVRGMVGGTQQSLNSFFTMISGCLGLIFRKPEQFWIIALAGYISIMISMILYCVGVVFLPRTNFQPTA